jgi:hypothetical protein
MIFTLISTQWQSLQLVSLKKDFQNWYPINPSIGIFKGQISNWNLFQKSSWKLRGEFHSGGFYLVKGKSFEKGGEISKLENASCNLFHIPLTIFKKTLKKIPKEFAKTKLVVQRWSKMLNKRKTIHSYLVRLSIGLIPSNLCTYHMQTNSFLHFIYLLWFALASITKKWEIGREIVLTFSYN